MQVHKFSGPTVKEAIASVKHSLGTDAMILATRKIKGSDRRDLFEITALPAAGERAAGDDPLRAVHSELVSLREILLVQQQSDTLLPRLLSSPEAFRFYAKLLKSGVQADYVRFFLERSALAADSSGVPEKDVRRRIVKAVQAVIKVGDPFAETKGRQIVAALVGTTGVGKTTTIAKLAGRLMLSGQKKVGLVSIDTYRIGAMAQLKTYADILGIPCFQAFKKADLDICVRKLAAFDVILIDTAGQSQYDTARIRKLGRMIGDDPLISAHLLLSAATTVAEMEKTALNFDPLNLQSYIFTKLDEAQTCGSIVNQLMRLNRPVSFLTTGQNVPEDIECADKQQILRRLLN